MSEATPAIPADARPRLPRGVRLMHSEAQGGWVLLAPERVFKADTIAVEIVKRCDAGKFVVLPKRWIVERTIGWLNRCRRLAKDWECLNRNGLAFLRWASVRMMLRKLCQA